MTNGEKIQQMFPYLTKQILANNINIFEWWNAEYKEPNTKNETLVSLNVYKQVAKERDIAIQQLHELGYDFGQKIEPRKGYWDKDGACPFCGYFQQGKIKFKISIDR